LEAGPPKYETTDINKQIYLLKIAENSSRDGDWGLMSIF